jgi:hypothetical protein
MSRRISAIPTMHADKIIRAITLSFHSFARGGTRQRSSGARPFARSGGAAVVLVMPSAGLICLDHCLVSVSHTETLEQGGEERFSDG